MATTTTNFGWDIPESTDLVKDGATAIAALGQDIDTALIDLKGGTTGQILSKASGTDLDFTFITPAAGAGLTLIANSPFTTVSSHSVNNCFTSTYANYKILIKYSAVSGDSVGVTMKLRASSTDTSTNYNSQRIFNGTTSTVATDNDNNGTDEWMAGLIDKDFATASFAQVEMASPELATNTSMVMQTWGHTTIGNLLLIGGTQASSTQFDGFTILCSTGTMSGTVYVYGYKEA
jgi:hypothetical protein